MATLQTIILYMGNNNNKNLCYHKQQNDVKEQKRHLACNCSLNRKKKHDINLLVVLVKGKQYPETKDKLANNYSIIE